MRAIARFDAERAQERAETIGDDESDQDKKGSKRKVKGRHAKTPIVVELPDHPDTRRTQAA